MSLISQIVSFRLQNQNPNMLRSEEALIIRKHGEEQVKIKETINVALECIDDSGQLDGYMYHAVQLFLVTDASIFATTGILYRLYSNKEIKNAISIYYNIYKERVNPIYISFLLLVLLFICYSSVTYCDAPRA